MNAVEYVQRELTAGRLTPAHIVELTKEFQALYGLEEDGKPGPETRRVIEAAMRSDEPAPLVLGCPLPVLPDGREAVITSGFKSRNPSRPNHNGVDLFYRWAPGD